MLLAVFLLALPALAGDKTVKKVVVQPPAPKLTGENRFAILRYLDAEKVHIRKPLPMGQTGLTLNQRGEISPNGRELTELLADHGIAAKPGDLAVITKIQFTSHSIIFEINGGPRKKGHWYQHIQVGTGTGMTSVAPSNDKDNAIGSSVTLDFPGYIPDLTVNQVKTLLEPVFDFNAHSSAQAYASSLPPKIRLAIEQHRVLVGMNREMVAAALGRPVNKIREKDDQGTFYEEWIYGQPPEDVQFVRFVGEEVVRVELMKVDGQRIVRSEREVDTQPAAAQAPAAPAAPAAGPRPTLRRPDEAPPDNAPGSIQNGPVVMPPDSSAPGVPNAPAPNAPPAGQTPPTPNGPN